MTVTAVAVIGAGLAGLHAALGREKLVRACLDQFARFFGDEARAPIARILKDWAAEPLTATAADRVAAGHAAPSNAPWVLGPRQQRLAMAGSETSPSDPGYLAGAIIEAQRAVAETLYLGVARPASWS